MREILFLLIMCSLQAVGQTETTFLIKGKVIDAIDGSAVEFANVFIENHDHICKSVIFVNHIRLWSEL